MRFDGLATVECPHCDWFTFVYPNDPDSSMTDQSERFTRTHILMWHPDLFEPRYALEDESEC